MYTTKMSTAPMHCPICYKYEKRCRDWFWIPRRTPQEWESTTRRVHWSVTVVWIRAHVCRNIVEHISQQPLKLSFKLISLFLHFTIPDVLTASRWLLFDTNCAALSTRNPKYSIVAKVIQAVRLGFSEMYEKLCLLFFLNFIHCSLSYNNVLQV